jgi:ESX secretion-associated protein EspG
VTALPTTIALPVWVVANLWEWEGHGQPHPIVGYDEYWTPPEERARFRTAVMAALRTQGLAHDGALVDELRDALWVLANAEHECYGCLYDRSGDDRWVLVAAADGRAVRFTRDDRIATVEVAPADAVAAGCVELLPDVAPARFPVLTVRESDYLPREDVNILVPPGVARLRELTSGARTGVHEFMVAARVGPAGTRVCGRPVTVLDLAERGRVVCRYVTVAGESHIRCLPGDSASLIATLGEVRAELSTSEGKR